MRYYIVSRISESGERVQEESFTNYVSALECYTGITKVNKYPREIGMLCGDIYNTFKDNYSIEQWVPLLKKDGPINPIFKNS